MQPRTTTTVGVIVRERGAGGTPMTSRSFCRRVAPPLALVLLGAAGRSAHAQTPPDIVFAQAPAILVQIDGDPEYRHVDGTDLDRVVNTQAVIVRDHADIHYLKVLDGWMESYGLRGNWSVSGVSPLAFSLTPPPATASTAAILDPPDALDSRGSKLQANPPAVYVETKPAVLIVTDGPRRYERVQGTMLERLVNTTATVFREPTDHQLYLLVGDRWFRAWTTDGPWEFVPAGRLPSDLARMGTLNGSK
jgi:hypothetical protein